MSVIKVLTLREPWASLIGEGIKAIETRSWRTNYRGELYIHAGCSPLPRKDKRMELLPQIMTGSFHFGTIFLKCQLIDCVPITNEFSEKEKKNNPSNFLWGDYSDGRYAWILKDIQAIDPIPAKGRLGLWSIEI